MRHRKVVTSGCQLVVLLLLALSISSSTAKQHPRQPEAYEENQPVLIVEYKTHAVTQAAAAIASNQPDLATAAVTQQAVEQATAAAFDRGASRTKQQAVATIAAEAAAVAPAVAALTSSVVTEALKSGVAIVGLTHYHTVLKGAALKTASVEDASALRGILSQSPSVKRVHESVSDKQLI